MPIPLQRSKSNAHRIDWNRELPSDFSWHSRYYVDWLQQLWVMMNTLVIPRAVSN